MLEPRNIRNRNPLNIRTSGSKWHGLASRAEMSPIQAGESDFCVFTDAKWGYRAATIVLRSYRDRHGLNTIEGVLGRWAPPGENDTGAYIRRVSDALDVRRDQEIDTADAAVLLDLFKVMTRIEAGWGDDKPLPWGEDVILAGVALGLGNGVPEKSIAQEQRESATRHVATAAGGSLLALGVSALVQIIGSTDPDQAEAVGVAAETLFTAENLQALGVLAGGLLTAWGVVKGRLQKALK